MANSYLEDVYNKAMSDEELESHFDRETINYYFRAIKSIREHQKHINEDADAQINDIQEWRDNSLQSDEKKIERFSESILTYYRIEKDKDKSFRLDNPYGNVSDRKLPDKWEYDDEELIKSLKSNGEKEFIEIDEKVKHTELKKRAQVINGKVITDNGVVIDGVKVEPQGRKVTVKIKGDKK